LAVAAFALSVIALIVAGAQDDDATTATGPGRTKTVAVELGSFYVKPDRVEVPPGTRLTASATNEGDMEHDLKLEGETGTERLPPGESQTVDFGVIDADTEAWCTVPATRPPGWC
jgi:nitrite reductase (NO-forming)